MKQRKVIPAQGKTVTPTTTRLEIEAYLKHISAIVEKDPKKAALVFKDWLEPTPQTQKKSRAA